MCGIVGIINHKAIMNGKGYNTDANLCSAMDDMIWADQLRGLDGTGIMQLTHKGKVEMLKVAGAHYALDNHKDYPFIQNWTDASPFTVGHNRAATRGKTTAENSHPFQCGDITLVHNGTLTYFPKKYGHVDPQHDVDSKAITKMIDELGFEKAVKEFDGAYALVWINEKEQTLNIARNSERPLAFVYYEGGVGFASEIYLPAWCLSRRGFKVDKLEHTKVNTLYTIHASNPKEMIETPFTPREKSYGFHYGHEAWDGVDDYMGAGYSALDKKEEKEKAKEEKTTKSHKGKKGEKLIAVGSTTNGVYTVGDEVVVQFDHAKYLGTNTFATVQGIIQEPVASELNHKVVGNANLPMSTISDFENIYSARISQIQKTSTGFFLINLRDIELIKTEKKPSKPEPSQVLLPAPDKLPDSTPTTPSGGIVYCGCHACKQQFPETELNEMKRIKRYQGGGGSILRIKVCEHCETCINLDPNLFDLAVKTSNIQPLYTRYLEVAA